MTRRTRRAGGSGGLHPLRAELRALPACLILAAMAAAAGTQPATPAPPSVPTETIAIEVREGTGLAFDLSSDGRTLAFDLLGQLWEVPGAGGRARPLTDAVRDVAEDLDPSYSPDGRRIVFRAERGGRTGLWLLEQGAAPIQLTQLDDPFGYEGGAAWSPDGKSIVFARLGPADGPDSPWRTRLQRIDLATREVHALPVPQSVGPDLRDPAWEPGGGRLVVVSARAGAPAGGRLWLVDVGGTSAMPLTAESSAALAPVFAPDARRLAFLAPDANRRTQVWMLALDTPGAAPIRLTDHADVASTRVRWTPDGRRLTYSADGRLWRIDAEGGTPEEIPFIVHLSFQRDRRSLPPVRFPEPGAPQPVRAFMGLALSPDARRVAMLALGKLWVMPAGGAARAVGDVPLSAHHLAWSPDGLTLVWSAGRWWEEDLFVTDLARASTRRLTALPGREERPLYSPDGRHLAFIHHPTEETTVVRVIEAKDREVSDPARGRSIEAEGGAEVAWAPDSEGLLYVTGGFDRGPTRGVVIGRTGEKHDLSRMPDSPLGTQWTAEAMVFVRHARLWRAPFDAATGLVGQEEPLGAEPAMDPSVSRDGTVLYLSKGGLRLRLPDGRERSLGWPISYTPFEAEPVLIRNARIIDGTGAPPTPPRDLLIERGRISKIAEAGVLNPGAARVLEASGRYVMPGLMDLHAHEYRPEMMPGFAYFGVTTIRDQGSPIAPLIAYADAVAAGILEGPRVDYGGFQFYSDWPYDTDDGQGVEPEADPGHLTRAVELARLLGSQHIKTRTFRRWDINARFIKEAHDRGMRVTGHCAHLLPLVAAGMDAKEHAGFCGPRHNGFIYDDIVQVYRAAGIGVVPTIAYSAFAVKMNEQPDHLAADTELAPFLPERTSFQWMFDLDAARRQEFSDFATSARQVTGRLARAGVTLGTGTDIWQIPTGVHLELEELVGIGISPLQAIHAATGGAARILGAERELGTIEVGKWADLVVLDANPAEDIRNTRRIRAVLRSGRVIDRAAIVREFQRQ